MIKFAIFNLIIKENGLPPVRCSYETMQNIIDFVNLGIDGELELVPYLGEIQLPETCDELLWAAGGPSKIDGGMREGIVLRTLDGVHSFKAVDNEFLLRYHG